MDKRSGIDPEKVVAALQSVRGRSTASILRPLLPMIDDMVREGTSHADVLAALKKEGIDVKLETLRTNLYRYRSEQRQKEGGGNE